MSQKTKKMADLSKGITSDMGDAEKTLTELRHQGINHFVIFHDSTQGLMSYFSKGKASLAPTPEPFPSHAPNLAEEMNAIREDLHLAPSTRVLLLLSLATDDMIRQ
ncbi:hypothetical protein THAOC_14382, partial [Thalassiosira oceanica]